MLAKRIAPFALLALTSTLGFGQVTQRVNVSSAGSGANNDSWTGSISADGRLVAFYSFADNLVPEPPSFVGKVYVRDRLGGTITHVSVGLGGAPGNYGSVEPAISADGRYVAFSSNASNLVVGDTNQAGDVFVRDLHLDVTERVSIDSTGSETDGHSGTPSISASGRYVAFTSSSSNLVPGDMNQRFDIFVRDRANGTTTRISVSTSGTDANSDSGDPKISPDGKFIAFSSTAANLVTGDTNGYSDIFLRDVVNGTTERVNLSFGGTQANNDTWSPAVSADGRFIAFSTWSTNLVPGDTNFWTDVFVRDRQLGTTERVSVGSSGEQSNGESFVPSISRDGRYVAFVSTASNLVSGDNLGFRDIFIRDRLLGTTQRISSGLGGAEADFHSYQVSLSPDAETVVFVSEAANIAPGDTGNFTDVFVHDRHGAPAFVSLCTPGSDRVIGCPCANPPAGQGRGCDNSSGTGGAVLSAQGGSYLSSDSLVFGTQGESPSALSIISQWNGTTPGGVGFGMGIRCTGGNFKRLYTRSAAGGSITAPDFLAGDAPVSVKSASLGDPIQAGESRWYLVYYRDPIVLGGCDAWKTFNATQTGQVTWYP